MPNTSKSPDAKLIAASAAWVAQDQRSTELSRALDDMPAGIAKDTAKAELDTLNRGYGRRLKAIAAMPATTDAGRAAKAAVVAQHCSDDLPDIGDGGVMASLIADLLRGVGQPATAT